MNPPLAMPDIAGFTESEAAAALAAPLTAAADASASLPASMESILHGYLGVFIAAFLVTIIATPLLRRLAIANGVVDAPGDSRKAHRIPVAYLGGAAVLLGLLAGVAYSYFGLGLAETFFQTHESEVEQRIVPISILLGMSLIALTGLLDDVIGLAPHLKIAGQLIAAAALAMEEVGTKVAQGVLRPLGAAMGNPELTYHIPVGMDIPVLAGSGVIEIDVIYWTGTAIIAIFVLGACNAANLVDGLDGLLAGVTAVAAGGLLVIALMLAAMDDGPLDGARVVLTLALLGACLGFLPHNFNPATIFLGDAGSLLLGFVAIVIILSLGDTGKTHLVIAGLIIYSIPIVDTVLAIVRRKMAGRAMSEADDQHLHHMLARALGPKGAVLTLYAAGLLFAGLGVWISMGRIRIVITIAMVIWAFIGITAVKVARRQVLEAQAMAGRRPRGRRELSGRPGSHPEAAGTAAATAKAEQPARAATLSKSSTATKDTAGAVRAE